MNENQNTQNTGVNQTQGVNNTQMNQPQQPVSQINSANQTQSVNPTNNVNQPQQSVNQAQPQMNQTMQQPVYTQPVYTQPTPQYVNHSPSIPPEYKPISAWGYIGYNILFAIPLVGFILMLVFSFGGTSNINLRNYARSFLCLILLGIIIFVVIFLLMGGLFTAMSSR